MVALPTFLMRFMSTLIGLLEKPATKYSNIVSEIEHTAMLIQLDATICTTSMLISALIAALDKLSHVQPLQQTLRSIVSHYLNQALQSSASVSASVIYIHNMLRQLLRLLEPARGEIANGLDQHALSEILDVMQRSRKLRAPSLAKVMGVAALIAMTLFFSLPILSNEFHVATFSNVNYDCSAFSLVLATSYFLALCWAYEKRNRAETLHKRLRHVCRHYL